MSDWEQCPEEKRKSWHLSSLFNYFCSGDTNLRVGIIACPNEYKEEDFLFEGILWGSRIGNGARTVVYFVAQDFSPLFLNAIIKLGGTLSAKAVYWREKLTPCLYPVQEKEYSKNLYGIEPVQMRSEWSFWQKQLNPVAWNHLKVIKDFFESLAKRRVRTSFEKNKIVFCWGTIEIAEIKKKGNKFELTVKVKWTRNKNIAAKFHKAGWVDYSGKINEEFRRAIFGIIELLENMEASGCLESKDLLALKLITDKDIIPFFFGKHIEYPWLSRERNSPIDFCSLYYFSDNSQVHVIHPVLEKPMQKVVHTLLILSFLEYSDLYNRGLPDNSNIRWNRKVVLLSQSVFIKELRLCQSWLKNAEQCPIYLLPEDWQTEGLKNLNELSSLEYEEPFF